MKTISIVREDNAVYVNGECRVVDCSTIDPNIRAVQWCHCPKRKKSKGHIEWAQDPLEDFKPNTDIQSLKDFQHLVDAWEAAPSMDVMLMRERADRAVKEAEELGDAELVKELKAKRAAL